MGLVEITVAESHRRRGLAVFLLSEAFRQFVRQGILHVEVQIRQTDAAALELYRKFGFQQVDQGGMWRKDA
jgi:ribosomal protein S18 acetylase RimI-like enzyme